MSVELVGRTGFVSIVRHSKCPPIRRQLGKVCALDDAYSMGYNSTMIEIREHYDFVAYMRDLRDVNAKVRIAQRIRRLALGNPGDVRAVGEGISELRIDYGPGYRVYYKRRGEVLIIVLCAGDKRSQDSDILNAKQIANELEEP
jgi:putative addiction module killer protein